MNPAPAVAHAPPPPVRQDSGTEIEGRRATQRAMGIGLIVWPSFFLLDVYMALVVFPGTPVWPFAAARVLLESMLFAMWRFGRRPRTSSHALRVMNRAMACGAALLISMMALPLGGLTSPYMHGLSIVMLVMSVSIPTPWRHSLSWLVPTGLMFPLVMAVASRRLPAVAAQWADRDALALFGAHYAFVVASIGIGSVCGHLVWLARRQVYEARRLGRYRLKAPIGRGAMNEVWLAWDDTLRRDVALKILRAKDAEEREVLERFVREARALSQLASPHTVRVFDFGGSDDGLYFIAMEHLVGADLNGVIRLSGRLAPARVVHLAIQMCRSLAEAHRAGIIHRDIKPANLFLTRVGDDPDVVKVVDFGMAKILERGVAVSQSILLGTPSYMAPELWQGRLAHPGSDVYALGATLYFALTGREPFVRPSNIHEMARAHHEESPPPPSSLVDEIPPSLDTIVLRCLAKRPELRYETVDALQAALESCVDQGSWRLEDSQRAWRLLAGRDAGWGGGDAGPDSLDLTATLADTLTTTRRD